LPEVIIKLPKPLHVESPVRFEESRVRSVSFAGQRPAVHLRARAAGV
jgi:hypothetical protein